VTPGPLIRIAAAGDIHCSDKGIGEGAEVFARLEEDADLLLLAGDLTTLGEPDQAAALAQVLSGLSLPILAVLGNHDWHANKAAEIVEIMTEAGVTVLERDWKVLEVQGVDIGIVGTKGFVGGFPDSQLPDFGEPLLRQVYAETTAEVSALEDGLHAVQGRAIRVVLLHYAPTTTTLIGEPPVIWAFLGSDRMAAPIAAHRPDLVLHGHGHGGTFEGSIGDVPVFNVAISAMGKDFAIFELNQTPRASVPDGKPKAVNGQYSVAVR
jgi:Icc-related predicted phosphoesterase